MRQLSRFVSLAIPLTLASACLQTDESSDVAELEAEAAASCSVTIQPVKELLITSLNVVEDAVYDVWPKSCAMSWPAGPDAPATSASSSNRSSAKKSGGGSAAPSAGENADGAPSAAPAPTPEPLTPVEPSAADNDPT